MPRACTRKWAGFTTETWGYTLNSDLLPGFDFSSSYSLFQGSTLSDTARFKPFLTSISASFSIGRDQNPLAVFARAVRQSRADSADRRPTPGTGSGAAAVRTTRWRRSSRRSPVAGRIARRRSVHHSADARDGARSSASADRARARRSAPTSSSSIRGTRCRQIAGGNPFLFDACVAQQRAQPTIDTPVGRSDGRRTGVPHSADDVAELQHHLQPHGRSGRRSGRRRTTSSAMSSPARSCRCSATCTTGARSSASRNRRTATSRSTSRSRSRPSRT